MGKGSKQRPCFVSNTEYARNYNRIFGTGEDIDPMMTIEVKINDDMIFRADVIQTGVTEPQQKAHTQPRHYRVRYEVFDNNNSKVWAIDNLYHDRVDGFGRLVELIMQQAKQFKLPL